MPKKRELLEMLFSICYRSCGFGLGILWLVMVASSGLAVVFCVGVGSVGGGGAMAWGAMVMTTSTEWFQAVRLLTFGCCFCVAVGGGDNDVVVGWCWWQRQQRVVFLDMLVAMVFIGGIGGGSSYDNGGFLVENVGSLVVVVVRWWWF
ncbi:Hypothetical predicted protein [Olea europaea subsp. europaea]|uniref:Transmembrane protein n=1 Tax=Olea europaea subsp. europaea TaxID=158383 RepID=A0A8S0V400_OLEEU|nr:Hypothetical predicted protein [Olea europaea subsp. europaea]